MEHKYTANEKMELINKYYESGKRLYRFCEDEHVARSTFYTWLKLYEASLPKTQMFEPITSIVKQEVNQTDKLNNKADTSVVKVTLPNGIKIECNYDKVGFILGEIKW